MGAYNYILSTAVSVLAVGGLAKGLGLSLCRAYLLNQLALCQVYFSNQLARCRAYFLNQLALRRAYFLNQLMRCRAYFLAQLAICGAYFLNQLVRCRACFSAQLTVCRDYFLDQAVSERFKNQLFRWRLSAGRSFPFRMFLDRLFPWRLGSRRSVPAGVFSDRSFSLQSHRSFSLQSDRSFSLQATEWSAPSSAAERLMPECKNGELELVGAGFGGPKGRKIERCEVLRSHSGDPTGEAAVVCGASGDFFCGECGWVCELCARSCSASGHQLTDWGELENRGQGSGTEVDISFTE